MKKIALCVAALLGFACTPDSADAACPVRAVRTARIVVAAPVVQRVVVAQPVVAVAHVKQVVVAQHFIAEPIRAFSVVAPVVVGYDSGYGTASSSSLLAEELKLERLRREQLASGDIDAKLAKFKAEVVAELKLALTK